MLVFPVDTDRRLSRRPWVNYGLVLVNVAVYLFTMWDIHAYTQHLDNMTGPRDTVSALQAIFPVTKYFLWPTAPQIEQYITHQFLHLGWLHLFGNMVFLFVFGNSVEDRLGKIGYLCLYLAGGVVAGLLHGMLKTSPILGASGAVAAVTAAYLVLFPLTYVRLFAWVTEFEVSSLVVIVYYILQDVVFNWLQIYRTAYLAHVGGYAFGFVAVVALLLSGVLPREPYDLVQWLKHKHRRKVFKKLSRRKAVWERDLENGSGPGSESSSNPSAPESREQSALRAQVQSLMRAGDLSQAAKAYQTALQNGSDFVLAEQDQLDVSNQLMQESEYEAAAEAYEVFLARYPSYPQRPSIELILGLLYARYLQEPERARTLLLAARPYLTADNVTLCETILKEIPGRRK